MSSQPGFHIGTVNNYGGADQIGTGNEGLLPVR
jgi:hypothetical protein